MPEQYSYDDFKGTMTVNKEVLESKQVERYGLRDYDAAVTATTWFMVTPYLRQCGPPAFSATLPPMVHAA